MKSYKHISNYISNTLSFKCFGEILKILCHSSREEGREGRRGGKEGGEGGEEGRGREEGRGKGGWEGDGGKMKCG